MRFDYMTRDHEGSLAPPFSPRMLSIVSLCLMLLGSILLLSLPRKELFQFMGDNKIPFVFLIVIESALVIFSFINLRIGGGEIIPKDRTSRLMREGIRTYEETGYFLSHGLPVSLLHLLFLIMLLLPLFIVSGAFSEISLNMLLKALSIFVTTILLCRMLAFMLCLIFGRFSPVGYILSRGFFIFFIFATLAFAPFVNPLMIVYGLFMDKAIFSSTRISAFSLYMILVPAAIILLILVNQLLVRHYNRHGGTEP